MDVRTLFRQTCGFLALLGISVTATPGAQPKAHVRELRSFYFVFQAVSDASPFRFDYILDVEPEGDNVLVRWIRIAALDYICRSTMTVKAATANLKGETPVRLAGKPDLCSVDPSALEDALRRVRPKGVQSINDTGQVGIVAHCSSSDRVFRFPYPEEVDVKKFRRRYPEYNRMWELYSRITDAAFGKRSVFYDLSSEDDLKLQRNGEKLVPTLRSGIFDAGFSYYCNPEAPTGTHEQPDCDPHPVASLLKDYRGVPVAVPKQTGGLVAPSLDQLSHFVPPDYPPLAKMARIEGSVELKLKVNPGTGAVTSAETVSGHPLLANSALEAAKQWRFNIQSVPEGGEVTVKLDFSFTCP